MSRTSPLSFHIDPSASQPIYRQLMEQVRAQIAGGRLEAGDFLPSVRQVAKAFDVNPMTISRAFTLLESEGVVERIRGKGMRVLAPPRGESVEERQAHLEPLLRAAAQRAHELNLSAEAVLDQLRPLLEELDNER
ncbi:MAG: GntR family transcriptional regulator [Acidobacteriota bacterium]